MDYSSNSQNSALLELSADNDGYDNYDVSAQDEKPERYRGMCENLRSLLEIPKRYRSIFKYPLFNLFQSYVMDDVLYSDSPVVISSPTGSGKTTIFELAIVRLLMQIRELNYSGEFKIIYMAPMKSLCNERLEDWHNKFSNFGLTCILVTGDSDNADYFALQKYHIILTTPEKWDAVTRKWKDNKRLVQVIKLFMIDEVHLLNEEIRGSILEANVSRMKTIQETMKHDKSMQSFSDVLPACVRFIAVSATIPNIEDIAEWLGFPGEPAVYYKISDDLRPVKLKKVVLGYQCHPNVSPFKFDLSLNYKLRSVIMQYSCGKPILIFCSTRKGVEIAAQHISNAITFHMSNEQKTILSETASKLLDNKLRKIFICGIGYHHAGITMENRNLIENIFRSGNLPVLVTTSTLAMGVNLPANLVIVKSTQHYADGGYKDYSESTLLQMIGRAGRPQFDSSAVAVIMTKSSEKERYEKLVTGTELVESNLHRHLREHLNAEVVLHTITDLAVALDWLRSTYLYVRALKNPRHYGMSAHFTKGDVEKKLQDLCQIEMNALARNGMMVVDQEDGFNVAPTFTGILMARYYLSFETMKSFSKVKGNENLFEILLIVCNSHEYSESFLRVNDKKTLNTLNRCKNKDTIRFELPGKIKDISMKVNCIIQAVFGCLKILDPSLSQETTKIMRVGDKVTKCLVEHLERKGNAFNALLNSIILSKCFHAKLWENSTHVARQLDNVGPVLTSMLVAAGKTSFQAILASSPRELERIINRSAPMGNQLIEEVSHLPFYELRLIDIDNSTKVKVVITLTNAEKIKFKCTTGKNSNMLLLVGESQNNLLFYKRIKHTVMSIQEVVTYDIDITGKNVHEIKAHLICENWVGIDCQASLSLKHETSNLNRDNFNTQVNAVSSTVSNDYDVPSKSNYNIKLYNKENNVSNDIFKTNAGQNNISLTTAPIFKPSFKNSNTSSKPNTKSSLMNDFTLNRYFNSQNEEKDISTQNKMINLTQFEYEPRKKIPKTSQGDLKERNVNSNKVLKRQNLQYDQVGLDRDVEKINSLDSHANDFDMGDDLSNIFSNAEISQTSKLNSLQIESSMKEPFYFDAPEENTRNVSPVNRSSDIHNYGQRNINVSFQNDSFVSREFGNGFLNNDIATLDSDNDHAHMKQTVGKQNHFTAVDDNCKRTIKLYYDFEKYLTDIIFSKYKEKDTFDIGIEDFILSLYSDDVLLNQTSKLNIQNESGASKLMNSSNEIWSNQCNPRNTYAIPQRKMNCNNNPETYKFTKKRDATFNFSSKCANENISSEFKHEISKHDFHDSSTHSLGCSSPLHRSRHAEHNMPEHLHDLNVLFDYQNVYDTQGVQGIDTYENQSTHDNCYTERELCNALNMYSKDNTGDRIMNEADLPNLTYASTDLNSSYDPDMTQINKYITHNTKSDKHNHYLRVCEDTNNVPFYSDNIQQNNKRTSDIYEASEHYPLSNVGKQNRYSRPEMYKNPYEKNVAAGSCRSSSGPTRGADGCSASGRWGSRSFHVSGNSRMENRQISENLKIFPKYSQIRQNCGRQPHSGGNSFNFDPVFF